MITNQASLDPGMENRALHSRRTWSFKASRASTGAEVASSSVAPGRKLIEELSRFTPSTVSRTTSSEDRPVLWWTIGAIAFLVVAAIVCHLLSLPAEITRWVTRACYIGIPFAALYALKKHLSASTGKLSQTLHRFVDTTAHLVQARSLIYSCDFISAESLLESALKKSPSKQNKSYIETYALLALVRAHMGKTDAADQMINTALQLAEHNFTAGPNDSRAGVLCTCLSSAGEIADLSGAHKESHHFYRRVLETMIAMQQPDGYALTLALTNFGHAANDLARFEDALPIIEKADLLSSGLNMSVVHQALILSGLAEALHGTGDFQRSEEIMAKAVAVGNNAEECKDRGRTFSVIAKVLAHTDKAFAERFYESALIGYSRWNPARSPEHVRLLQNFAALLRTTGKEERAATLKNDAVRMQRTLQEISLVHKLAEKAIDKKLVQQVAVKPARFPFSWSLFLLWQGFVLWEAGLRVASHQRWCLFIFAAVVVFIKLKHLYSPPSKEQLGEGALTAMLAVVPFARSVMPELSAMPKRQLIVVAISTVMLVGVAKLVAIPEGQVPDGLMACEYLRLGQNLAQEEMFDRSAVAFDKAISSGKEGDDSKSARRMRSFLLPGNLPPVAAVQQNLKALECQKDGNNEAASTEWRACIAHYPDFEAPYVHLALLNLRTSKLAEAQGMLEFILKKNPNYADAVLAMATVRQAAKDPQGASKYIRDYVKLIAGKKKP